jgi:hypothetical protein
MTDTHYLIVVYCDAVNVSIPRHVTPVIFAFGETCPSSKSTILTSMKSETGKCAEKIGPLGAQGDDRSTGKFSLL